MSVPTVTEPNACLFLVKWKNPSKEAKKSEYALVSSFAHLNAAMTRKDFLSNDGLYKLIQDFGRSADATGKEFIKNLHQLLLHRFQLLRLKDVTKAKSSVLPGDAETIFPGDPLSIEWMLQNTFLDMLVGRNWDKTTTVLSKMRVLMRLIVMPNYLVRTIDAEKLLQVLPALSNLKQKRHKTRATLSMHWFEKICSDEYLSHSRHVEKSLRELKNMASLKCCDTCGTQTARLKLCKGCLSAFYCTRICQKADWIRHKNSTGCTATGLEGKNAKEKACIKEESRKKRITQPNAIEAKKLCPGFMQFRFQF